VNEVGKTSRRGVISTCPIGDCTKQITVVQAHRMHNDTKQLHDQQFAYERTPQTPAAMGTGLSRIQIALYLETV